MSLWSWLKSWRGGGRQRPNAVAIFDERGVSCRWPGGTKQSVAWDDVQSVEIRTTDEGPFLEDVFLVLHAGDRRCIIPQEAEGFPQLIERIQKLPGFDNEAAISAMSCAENATFLCWRRGA